MSCACDTYFTVLNRDGMAAADDFARRAFAAYGAYLKQYGHALMHRRAYVEARICYRRLLRTRAPERLLEGPMTGTERIAGESKFAAFGEAVWRKMEWPETFDLDCFDAQDIAIETGLLVLHEGEPHEDCDACDDGGPCYVVAPDIDRLLALKDGEK